MCKGRCRGASSARSSGVRQCRVPDELELRELVGLTFSLSGTLHAWESPNALRAVIHGYALERKRRFRRGWETANPGVEAGARCRRKIRKSRATASHAFLPLLGSDHAAPLSMPPTLSPRPGRRHTLLPSSHSGPRLKDACEVRNAQCLAVAAHIPLSWKTLLEEQG